MSIQNQIPLPSKIKRFYENIDIHNLFIYNRSGICFYGKSFTDYFKVEKNLVSPFITALMSFSKEMIGKRFKKIEMGDVKFVIFEKGSLNYNFLCDTIENENFLEEAVSKINNRLTAYIRKKKINIDSEIVYDGELNAIIDNIIDDSFSSEFNLKIEEHILEYMKQILSINEIDGIIFLTDGGKVIYSSYSKLDLKNFLKEVEFRVKICNNSILKLFYTFEDRRFIFSEYVQNKYFIILVFDSHVKFGMAEHLLTRTVDSVKRMISNQH
ncbi:MAG: hypothetical protein JSV23_00130 [Promethearchaeota archaeon]|nr:MAG: hypothetical protein JSV23_00130 [Candidatus Lokiarchaeota archaeon]